MSLDVGSYSDDDGRSYETGRVSLGSVQQMLGRIELNIQSLRQDVHYMREAQMNRETATERRFNDHETRLRAVESKRYIEPKSVTAVFAIVLPICAVAVSVITIMVK